MNENENFEGENGIGLKCPKFEVFLTNVIRSQ